MGIQELKQHHSIWTPELVELSLPLAGITRRCLARLVDNFILFLIYTTLLFLLFMSLALFPAISAQAMMVNATKMGTWILIIFYITFLLADFFYFWAFHTWMNGQTPGKKWLRIRVVSVRGGRINANTSLIRSLFSMVDMAIGYGGLSALMILLTDDEKRVADFAAGTIVVYEDP